MIKAVFDARSTQPSSNMIGLGEYTPAVIALANPADTNATKKNPIAIQTEHGGINITGVHRITINNIPQPYFL